MPEATAAAKANKAKHAASPLGLPTDEMPKFGVPKMQALVALREFADKGVVQAKENCEKIQSATKDIYAGFRS
jgi:hypothetical protein